MGVPWPSGDPPPSPCGVLTPGPGQQLRGRGGAGGGSQFCPAPGGAGGSSPSPRGWGEVRSPARVGALLWLGKPGTSPPTARKRLEEAPLVTKALREAQMKEKLQRYPKVQVGGSAPGGSTGLRGLGSSASPSAPRRRRNVGVFTRAPGGPTDPARGQRMRGAGPGSGRPADGPACPAAGGPEGPVSGPPHPAGLLPPQ